MKQAGKQAATLGQTHRHAQRLVLHHVQQRREGGGAVLQGSSRGAAEGSGGSGEECSGGMGRQRGSCNCPLLPTLLTSCCLLP